MATSINFNNRFIKLAGVYTRITSGDNNQEQSFTYGNVLVIDQDPNSQFGGGAGIDGELNQGEDSIYEFSRLIEMRDFIGGGRFYDTAKALFKPLNGQVGASRVFYLRMLSTIASTLTLTGSNGEVVVKCRYEGEAGNGIVSNGRLTQGFSAVLESGVVDSTKFRLKLKRGRFTGLASDGIPYDGAAADSTNPIVIAQSPEVSDFQEIVDWMNKDEDFKNNFRLDSFTAGPITSADLTAFSSDQLFVGGSQNNTDPQLIDKVLDAIGPIDYSHVLAPDSGVNATSANNMKLLSHLQNEAKYDKIMVVAGGNTKAEFQGSIDAAKQFDSERVVLVHGGIYEEDLISGAGLREKDSLQKAAYVIGRVSGLAPQTPLTFKAFDYAGEVHKVSDTERELALDAGVLTTSFNFELRSFICTQGINTLQANTTQVNSDGTSHVWQSMRIVYQLNKELLIQATIDLLGNQSLGPNRNTLDEGVVEEWTKGFLSSRTASSTSDNLILSFRDITTNSQGDALFVNYAFTANSEVNKIFFTGILL